MFIRKAILNIGFLLLILGSSNPAYADYEKEQAAFDAGDAEKAFKEWLVDATQGNTNAQAKLGYMYIIGLGVQRSDAEAFRWFLLAAEQGHEAAIGNVGAMYRSGQGVPKNNEEALRWNHLGAELGYVMAQHNLGVVYERGQGVPQDFVKASKWYRLAADQGDVDAQEALQALLQKMTQEQIAEAQRLSAEWQEEHK